MQRKKVIVLGSGLAGTAAALEAAAAGADVVMIEKQPSLGGSAALSAGMYWTAPDLDAYRKRIPDADMIMAKAIIEGFQPGLEFLRQSGVRVAQEPTKNIMTFGHGYSFDVRSFLKQSWDKLKSEGHQILMGITTNELVTENGVVTGVQVNDGEDSHVITSDAIVLATGGFQGSEEILDSYLPRPRRLLLRSNAGSVGDALRLTERVGVTPVGKMDSFYGHLIPWPVEQFGERDYLPYSQYYSGSTLIFNQDGQRFIDETLGDELINQRLVEQPGSVAVMIFDSRVHETEAVSEPFPGLGEIDRLDVARKSGGQVASASSLDELLNEIANWGFNTAKIAATLMDSPWEEKRGGTCPDDIPVSEFSQPPQQPPFYAVAVQPTITFTFGGLPINATGQVLGSGGRPVKGLYAAGADVGGISHFGYAGGLAPALITGRIAGISAACATNEVSPKNNDPSAPTRVTDIIIVGAGGAGLSAAISAATSGAEVLVLEKCDKLGGSTGRSVGSFTAANTSYQYRAGVNDSIDEFIADMAIANGDDEARENLSLREIFAQNAGSTLQWLDSIGVSFLGPTPEPPYKKPRMHNVLPNSKAYVQALIRESRKHCITIKTTSRVEKLLRNQSGAVIGVSVDGERYFARKGVILAAGDYSADPDIKRHFVGAAAAKVPAVNPYNTGDGFRLGSDVGAAMLQMDRLYEGLRFPPAKLPDPIKLLPSSPLVGRLVRAVTELAPKDLLAVILRGALTSWVGPNVSMYHRGAILVSEGGKRLANEDSDSAMARGVASAGGQAYMIFDEKVAQHFSKWPNPVSTFPGVAYAYVNDYKRYRPDVYHEAATLESLAKKIGVDASTLRASVEQYNVAVNSGNDPEFGRQRFGEPFSEGPFYALGPMQPYITLADGGLAVNDHLQVITQHSNPIPGLWAAGSNGQGGLQLLNHGLHIAWAFVSGRIVGRNAAAAPTNPDLVPVGEDQSALSIPAEELNVVSDRHFRMVNVPLL